MNNIEFFKDILTQIMSSSENELVNELIEYAIQYAQIRVKWQLADNKSRMDLEESRTATHNAFIDSCNILSRGMVKVSEDASWREQLGNDRKVIGDFACYIHYHLSLLGR